jgi:hypothetical protein
MEQVIKYGMNVAEFIACMRFNAFPFIPECEKRRPIRILMQTDVQHPSFQYIMYPLVKYNQFAKFCKALYCIHRKKSLHRPLDTRVDIELIETLFWEETTPQTAKKILQILLQFPHTRYESVWSLSTNLLLSSSTTEEKECTLAYMEAYLDLG